MTKKIDSITLEILWNRLLSITDEAGLTLIKSCFSSIVRDSHDFSVAIFDEKKRLLAQCSTSTPGQVGCMPPTIENICRVFPPEKLEPGDIIGTNDPWQASTHLNDISLASPIFSQQKLVGFTVCTVHHIDIGGRHATLESESIFEEGLWIPICKFVDAGIQNELLFDIIRHNVRTPEGVVGDIRAQFAALHLSSIRINELLSEYNLENLSKLGDEIISRSEQAMRREIKKLPNGTYRHSFYLDKIENERPKLSVAVTIIGDQVVIDFEGTSRQIHHAINSIFNMTKSFCLFAIKSLLDPFIPNNEGCLRPITVKAPEGSLVNPKWPAPVWGRTMVIHRIPELIYGALSSILPDKVIAESGSAPLGCIGITGVKKKGEPCLSVSFFFGGMGGRSSKDGVCCLSFPGNVANSPVELIEYDAPILWEKRELLSDSGGAGKYRGGCGQEFAFSVPRGKIGPMENEPIFVALRGGRFERPSQGIIGGQNSNLAEIIVNGKPKELGGRFALKPGDLLQYKVPGGGGYKNPLDRDPSLVEEDVKNSLVSVNCAKEDYGVIIDKKTLKIDQKATERLRASMKGKFKKY